MLRPGRGISFQFKYDKFWAIYGSQIARIVFCIFVSIILPMVVVLFVVS